MAVEITTGSRLTHNAAGAGGQVTYPGNTSGYALLAWVRIGAGQYAGTATRRLLSIYKTDANEQTWLGVGEASHASFAGKAVFFARDDEGVSTTRASASALAADTWTLVVGQLVPSTLVFEIITCALGGSPVAGASADVSPQVPLDWGTANNTTVGAFYNGTATANVLGAGNHAAAPAIVARSLTLQEIEDIAAGVPLTDVVDAADVLLYAELEDNTDLTNVGTEGGALVATGTVNTAAHPYDPAASTPVADTIAGTLYDADGTTPVVGGSVTLHNATTRAHVADAVSGAAGDYSFGGLTEDQKYILTGWNAAGTLVKSTITTPEVA